jgi:alpha-beta hydrolase superfamily lysophospholipase
MNRYPFSKCWLPLLYGGLLLACTPALQPTRHGEPQATLARGHFVAADGAVLPVRSCRPPAGPWQALVVALHGFNDYGRAFEGPGQYLSQRGIAVIAYDQRGFGNAPGRGLWAGTARYTADLKQLITQLRRQHPGVPVYVLGESMGGAVAIAALTGPAPPAVDGLILSAPAVWSRDLMPWYQRAILALAAAALPELELTGRGLKIQASDNIEMLRGLGRDPLVIKGTRVDAIDGLTDLMDAAQERAGLIRAPVLVLYGARDQIIPKRPVESLLAKLRHNPGARSVLYPAGYHLLLRDLQAGVPLRDISAWIADHEGPLPSGFEMPPG